MAAHSSRPDGGPVSTCSPACPRPGGPGFPAGEFAAGTARFPLLRAPWWSPACSEDELAGLPGRNGWIRSRSLHVDWVDLYPLGQDGASISTRRTELAPRRGAGVRRVLQLPGLALQARVPGLDGVRRKVRAHLRVPGLPPATTNGSSCACTDQLLVEARPSCPGSPGRGERSADIAPAAQALPCGICRSAFVIRLVRVVSFFACRGVAAPHPRLGGIGHHGVVE